DTIHAHTLGRHEHELRGVTHPRVIADGRIAHATLSQQLDLAVLRIVVGRIHDDDTLSRPCVHETLGNDRLSFLAATMVTDEADDPEPVSLQALCDALQAPFHGFFADPHGASEAHISFLLVDRAFRCIRHYRCHQRATHFLRRFLAGAGD